MIDAQRVLAQAQQGRFPADWQVFRGKRRSSLAVGCMAIFLTIFLAVFLGIAALILTTALNIHSGITSFLQTSNQAQPGQAQPLTPSDPRFFPLAGGSPRPLIEVGIGILVLAVVVGIIATLIAARDAGNPDPLLVVLPQGFVEYISHRKPIQSFAFAELSNIVLRVGTRTYQTANGPIGPGWSAPTTRTTVHFWLDLYYRNGRKGKWKQRAKFGAPEAIAQVIIAAQAQYVALARRQYAR